MTRIGHFVIGKLEVEINEDLDVTERPRVTWCVRAVGRDGYQSRAGWSVVPTTLDEAGRLAFGTQRALEAAAGWLAELLGAAPRSEDAYPGPQRHSSVS